MKKAFTMIELIFVIIVIGIIASIGMPRMMAIRDDAKIVTELDGVANTMSSIVNVYNAHQRLDTNESISKCFRVYAHEVNGSMYLGVEDLNSNSLPSYCIAASREADRNGLLGEFVVKVKGSSVYTQ